MKRVSEEAVNASIESKGLSDTTQVDLHDDVWNVITRLLEPEFAIYFGITCKRHHKRTKTGWIGTKLCYFIRCSPCGSIDHRAECSKPNFGCLSKKERRYGVLNPIGQQHLIKFTKITSLRFGKGDEEEPTINTKNNGLEVLPLVITIDHPIDPSWFYRPDLSRAHGGITTFLYHTRFPLISNWYHELTFYQYVMGLGNTKTYIPRRATDIPCFRVMWSDDFNIQLPLYYSLAQHSTPKNPRN
jgi:hypothetical protein